MDPGSGRPSRGRPPIEVQQLSRRRWESSRSTSTSVDVSSNDTSIPSLPVGESVLGRVLTRTQKRNRKRKPGKKKRKAARMEQESLKRVLKGNDDSHTECPICMDEFDLIDRKIVKFDNCRHMCCNECLLKELSISNEPKCFICRCPHPNPNANLNNAQNNAYSGIAGGSSSWSSTHSSGWSTREPTNNPFPHYTWGNQPHQRISLPSSRSPPVSSSSDSDEDYTDSGEDVILTQRRRDYIMRRTGVLERTRRGPVGVRDFIELSD